LDVLSPEVRSCAYNSAASTTTSAIDCLPVCCLNCSSRRTVCSGIWIGADHQSLGAHSTECLPPPPVAAPRARGRQNIVRVKWSRFRLFNVGVDSDCGDWWAEEMSCAELSSSTPARAATGPGAKPPGPVRQRCTKPVEHMVFRACQPFRVTITQCVPLGLRRRPRKATGLLP
jgi:hypothetical protein